MLTFVDVPAMTSIPLTTVAQIVAGEPFADPAGGVSIEQLVPPNSFFSYFQPWPLSRSYMLFMQSSSWRVLRLAFGTLPADRVRSPPGTLHEHALLSGFAPWPVPGISPSRDSPTVPTAALICAAVRSEHGCEGGAVCAAACRAAMNPIKRVRVRRRECMATPP